MLTLHLHKEGFFPIRWAETATPGTTYVRPGAKGVLRAFVLAQREEMELFVGSLFDGKLHYRGPVNSETELRQLLVAAYSTPATASTLKPAGNQPVR
jgi:hypothetical protein